MLASGLGFTMMSPMHASKSPVYARPVSMLSSAWPAMEDGRAPGRLEKDANVLFTMIDKDGNGEISMDEFSEHLRACGYEQDRIASVFKSIDVAPSDGHLSAAEFSSAWVKHPTMRTAPGLGMALKEKLHTEADVLFAALDVNTDGTISQDELKTHMVACGYQTDELVEKIFKTIDFDASGEVDESEFRKAFLTYPSMRTLSK